MPSAKLNYSIKLLGAKYLMNEMEAYEFVCSLYNGELVDAETREVFKNRTLKELIQWVFRDIEDQVKKGEMELTQELGIFNKFHEVVVLNGRSTN